MVHPTRSVSIGGGGPRSDSDKPRLLVVEDDDALRTTIVRLIGDRFHVTALGDGASAADLLVRQSFDVVLSDIGLPGMTGVDLLRLVRSYDLDVPVVLMTGQPTVETAIEAVELGALMYIAKPFEHGGLQKALERASKLARIAKVKREMVDAGIGGSPLAGDRVGLEASFRRALDGLWIAYQPIVEATTQRTIAYEALMRSTEPTMPHPGALLEAAERLNRLEELGRHVRKRAVDGMRDKEETALLFVNLHSNDLLDDHLYDAASPLSQMAHRVVLEITERATLDHVHDVRRRSFRLRELGFQLAVDDLGAGYAGLTSFATLEPEIVKLDMSLIRNVDASPIQARIVDSVTKLSRELNMRVVAEGIETNQELRCVLDSGCDLLQGFLLGRPERDAVPSSHTWERRSRSIKPQSPTDDDASRKR